MEMENTDSDFSYSAVLKPFLKLLLRLKISIKFCVKKTSLKVRSMKVEA
jgi:hypothetical protein